MEKRKKKRAWKEAKKEITKYYEIVGDYFEDEKATSFEVVATSVLLIVSACIDNLILPPEAFKNALIQFIDFHTAKK